MACALGIVQKKDSNLLAVNGEHIVITKSWACYLLKAYGLYVKKEGMQQSQSNSA